MSEAALRVTGNTPRLLQEGEMPPPPADVQTPVEELEVPHVYWTADKAQHIVAKICHAASKFYGPNVKAADWELELIGEPAAAVLNDFMPLRAGASSDRMTNLVALAVVAGIIIALRLPDILEQHGVIKQWRPKNAPPQETSTPSPAPAVSSPAPPAAPDAFAAQFVGSNGAASNSDRQRDEIWGAQSIGGGGFTQERP